MSESFVFSRKFAGAWFVESSNRGTSGPYLSGLLAFKVAVIEYVAAKKRAPVEFFVLDDRGSPHVCRLIENKLSTHRCLSCESTWMTGTRTLHATCPLWAALRGSRIPEGVARRERETLKLKTPALGRGFQGF
ncbi:hypothetical protein [Rhodoplanes sp. Z2-YC6860]|uniref:hypothetical protein n=1 Tax=Rhodoplanes sp. Z2-YC6860 TaxID=674703 RepID=UPI0012ED34E2|nr:hypothetical protein [Rhodoplanes sp. Z2-YC6860]